MSHGRGTHWVAGQFALMACTIMAGFLPPAWPDGLQRPLRVVGTVLALAGAAFAVWAGRALGRSLTPFPRPVPAGLATEGPFALVRHPVYTGGLAFFGGYALFTGVPALAGALALALLWAAKVRVEERLLAEVYDDYPAYERRVRWRLVPFVY